MPAPPANIALDLLRVGRDGDPALIYRGSPVTYAQLREGVRRAAAAFLGLGLGPGDRVGIAAENSPTFVEGYLGAMWAGMVAVPLQAGLEESSFRAIVEATDMRALVAQGKAGRAPAEWVGGMGVPVLIDDATEPPAGARSVRLSQSGGGANTDAQRVTPDQPGAIVFTSGSTGKPKGVVITHANIAANTGDIVSYLALTRDDRMMAVLPMSYCYGASLLHTHLAVGGSVTLAASFMFPEKALDEMEQTACTGLAGVPSTFQILLRKTRFPQRKFPALRHLQQAGGRLPVPFIRELRAAQPGARLFIMYGQTEATARLSYLPPERLDDKLGSIGRGLPSTRLEVLDEHGAPVRPGSGAVGEIVASGLNIAQGYWRDPEETARYFRSGRLHTGDLATVDDEGYIFVVDRAREFIKSMGNRVSSKEIEDVLCEHPDVVEAAVVGAPDDLYGEAICAYVVVRRPALTEADLRQFCASRLPNHKTPQLVRLVPDLPKGEQGKVRKAELRERAARERTAGGNRPDGI